MNFFRQIADALSGRQNAFAGRCPVCGAEAVKSRIRKPLGPFVKDGPTVMEMKCSKCGHCWSIPLRAGP